MSDIFIKNAGQGSAGWRKASNLFIKNAGQGSAGWRPALAVWIRNLTQWVKVWPLSGIIATRVPYIGYFSSDTYANRMPNATYPVIRIGDSYFGDNAQWDLNGWSASSYTYRWKLFTEFDSEISTIRSGTGSGWTSTTGEDQLPTSVWTSTNSTNADNQFLGFEVTANNSSNSQYNGLSISTKVKVIRDLPVNLTASLSTNTPTSGTAITYSSTWQTGEAYKADANRIYINWYTNSTSTTVGGTYVGSGSSYTPVVADNGKYIYAREERQNSGTDYELGLATGIVVSRVTTSPVGTSPNAFTYSLTNVGTVTTPSAPVQQRVSSTSNTVLVEMSSAFPSDTESYELWTYGSGSAAGGTLANPAVQSITTLNQYFSNGDIAYNGTFDTVTNISSSASNSPISTISRAIGATRTLQFNASTTTGAQSWRINYTISSASGGNGTYTLDTNSMPRQTIIGGVSNPTVTINSITAYSGLDQTGSTTAGTAGFPTSLSSITKPSAFSTTSTSNYTFYTNLQVTGSQRRVTLPSAFTSGTTVYVSTNGYINWGGDDPAGSTSIPSLSTSGITVAPLAGDLRQGAVSASGTTSTGGLWYFADATNYWVTWWGNYYQDASQVARYQVKFYWGQSYADVYIINNSLTTLTPSTTAVQNGANQYQSFSSTTSQTSTLLSTASMNRVSTQDGVDDNRTAIVATAPQAPSGGTATVDPTTGTAGSTTYTASTSGWSGTPTISYSYAWQRFTNGSFQWETLGTGTTFAPTVAQNNVALSWQIVVTASNGISPNGVATKAFTVNAPVTPITPTISMSANTGVGQTAGTINWTSTNQSTWSSTGTFSGSGTTEKTLAKTGLTAGTTYTGTVTVTSSTGHTASANYSLTTTSAATVPTNTSQPTLSGGLAVGSTFTFTVGSWSGSPTSYDLRLYRGTPGVVTSETLVKSAGNVTSSTYVIPQSDFDDPSNRRYYRAFASATNAAGTSNSGTLTPGVELGPITSAPATPVPVLSTITGDNSLTLGGTFSWSFTNSPTAYSVFCTGPTGTVFTTSNAYTYTGTTFRPGYDGTGWQGSGDYTIYVNAKNAGGNSTTASFTRFMS